MDAGSFRQFAAEGVIWEEKGSFPHSILRAELAILRFGLGRSFKSVAGHLLVFFFRDVPT